MFKIVIFLLSAFYSSCTINVLHLTDIHYDPYFLGNSSIYSFCHRLPDDDDEELANGLWGRDCDSSASLVEQSLQQISAQNNNISFIFLTGDNSRHEDDDNIPKTRNEIISTNMKLKSWLKHYFPDAPIIFSIGNNDAIVHDTFLPGPNDALRLLGDIWLDEFGSECIESFRIGGYWPIWISDTVKVISLNTLYFFKNNYLSVECGSDGSPGSSQIKWLELELLDAQREDAKAIIIGHVPPIDVFYHETCLEEYLHVVQSYSNVISYQCFGHIHMDDIFILKNQDIPVGFSLTSPALNTVFNPAYRIYEISGSNGSLIDYHQYYAPLRDTSLNFRKEYSCQEAFGNGPLNFEYFLNLDLRAKQSSVLRIKRKRFKFVKY